MDFILRDTRLGLLNVRTRLPFRYGIACLTACPQATLEATIEVAGQLHSGYSGDNLPPAWFDKTPNLPYRRQIADMLGSIARAERAFMRAASAKTDFFSAWLQAYSSSHEEAAREGIDNGLLTSFGVSIVERAVMDALARSAGLSFAQAVRTNLYQIRPGEIHGSLRGLEPADWLPAEPKRSMLVRQTIGLGDPIATGDIPLGERLNDGFPQSVEDYAVQSGIRCFKLKISPDIDMTRHRAVRLAELCQRLMGHDYLVTLDANELFQSVDELESMIETLRAAPQLRIFLENVVAIEQPLARHVALAADHAGGRRRLSQWRPVIIDESDGTLEAYARAMECGYRGTSSKSCKGPVKSLLNAGLTWLANRRGETTDYLMTGEDLTCLGVVPLQADVALAATLGFGHLERNGHHYFPGLSYLPEAERRAALFLHGDLYQEHRGRAAVRIREGRLEIGSLQCPGLGFAALPDMTLRQRPGDWRFESLGLEE
jgi:hypothetical protein